MNEKLERLRQIQPGIVALAEQLALKGYTLDAIAQGSGLGRGMIEAVLAQECPDNVVESLMKSALAAQVPAGSTLTYGLVRGLVQSRRDTRNVKVADSTSNLREALLSRAMQLVQGGHVASWREVMSGLRVLGVPTAGAVTDAGHARSGAPIQYVYDDSGQMVENPAYTQWLAKGNPQANSVPLTLNIGIDLLRQGGTGAIGRKPLHTDDAGNIVALEAADGGTKSLTSMPAQDLHKLAYGADAKLVSSKPDPLVSEDDLL